MKTYKFKINGKDYDVTIGEAEGKMLQVNVNGADYQVELENAPASAPAAAASAGETPSARSFNLLIQNKAAYFHLKIGPSVRKSRLNDPFHGFSSLHRRADRYARTTSQKRKRAARKRNAQRGSWCWSVLLYGGKTWNGYPDPASSRSHRLSSVCGDFILSAGPLSTGFTALSR